MCSSQQAEKTISVTVKLYGTLPHQFGEYDPQKGLVVQLTAGSRIADLIMRLELSGEFLVPVMDGKVVNSGHPLTEGDSVTLLQPAHGG